uniref:Uncharacterized protein n=1 Tax=Arundo donax TaxID=35708 RepID=A0A0A9A1C4_ARUDO
MSFSCRATAMALSSFNSSVASSLSSMMMEQWGPRSSFIGHTGGVSGGGGCGTGVAIAT